MSFYLIYQCVSPNRKKPYVTTSQSSNSGGLTVIDYVMLFYSLQSIIKFYQLLQGHCLAVLGLHIAFTCHISLITFGNKGLEGCGNSGKLGKMLLLWKKRVSRNG